LTISDSLIKKFFIIKKGVAPKMCYTFFDLECLLKHDSLIFLETVNTFPLLAHLKDKFGICRIDYTFFSELSELNCQT